MIMVMIVTRIGVIMRIDMKLSMNMNMKNGSTTRVTRERIICRCESSIKCAAKEQAHFERWWQPWLRAQVDPEKAKTAGDIWEIQKKWKPWDRMMLSNPPFCCLSHPLPLEFGHFPKLLVLCVFLQDDRMSGDSTAVNSQEAASSQSLNGSSGGTARWALTLSRRQWLEKRKNVGINSIWWCDRDAWRCWWWCGFQLSWYIWYWYVLIMIYIYIHIYTLIIFQLLISAYAFSLSSFRWAGLINATSSQSRSTWDEGTSPTDWRNSRGSGAASPELIHKLYIPLVIGTT